MDLVGSHGWGGIWPEAQARHVLLGEAQPAPCVPWRLTVLQERGILSWGSGRGRDSFQCLQDCVV